MTRFWHELVAAIGDHVLWGVPGLGLWLLLLAAIVAVLWYFWPEWWHRLARVGRRRSRGAGRGGRSRRRWRWPGFRGLFRRFRLRWRRRRKRPQQTDAPEDLPPDQLPDLPAAVLTLSADELAAQGRYKEAVRERLRAIVRDLVERDVIAYRPGWTVTELAAAAATARPPTGPPLAAASEVFSGIWYGEREARAADDAAMREYAAGVRTALEREPVTT
jgi:hypothetical protein